MHNRARFLIFFQYIGTKYSGAAKVPPDQLQMGKKGIQDHLEEAIMRLKPVTPLFLRVSSRTDKGVHAICNTAHFDLQCGNDKPLFTEEILVEALNYHLASEQIQVTRAQRVPDDFHARFRAQSRTYVYRLALGISHPTLLPVTERDLCWNLHSLKLDFGAMHEAAALLLGTHDFSSFRAPDSKMALKSPVKTMDVVSLQPGSSFARIHFHRDVPFWELTFKSRSFLYKQVRRMVGAIVAVGLQTYSVPQLKSLLDARDSMMYPSWMTAPPRGLFLTRVEYRESDLQLSQQSSEDQLTSSGNLED
ncbi:tRNA pseudouridine synthase-like 1 [Thalassophryne amazonica]|uniref:tRNA pseudouridine synthase-like 1 n=1 Tax=Thalassophryne amazonica TaxID=390379 RepID=UPI001471D308|nr:tRNA pseudouridine synthase-like 1 [Thalassophryne amazonica]